MRSLQLKLQSNRPSASDSEVLRFHIFLQFLFSNLDVSGMAAVYENIKDMYEIILGFLEKQLEFIIFDTSRYRRYPLVSPLAHNDGAVFHHILSAALIFSCSLWF